VKETRQTFHRDRASSREPDRAYPQTDVTKSNFERSVCEVCYYENLYLALVFVHNADSRAV
jgi:hypothetical protein